MNEVRPSLNVIVMSMRHIYLRKMTVVTAVFYNKNNTNFIELNNKSIQLFDLNLNHNMTEN